VQEEVASPTQEDAEQRWLSERRREALAYIAAQPIEAGELGEVPAWYLYPYLALWAVESGRNPGWIGWWVLCGDCPTDYVACSGDRSPRTAILELSSIWNKLAESMAAGNRGDEVWIKSERRPEDLAPLLCARAQALAELAKSDEFYDGSSHLTNAWSRS
jgi:Domain of unknown function (DUF4826)